MTIDANRFRARRSPLADIARAVPDDWLTAPQPGAIALVGGAAEHALPALKEPAARLRAGPEQWLIVSEGATPTGLASQLTRRSGAATVTDLSHARVRIRLHGPRGREALRSGVPIDPHPSVLPAGHSTPAAFRHVAVMLHAVAAETFDLYLPRSYAASLWQWLEDIPPLSPA